MQLTRKFIKEIKINNHLPGLKGYTEMDKLFKRRMVIMFLVIFWILIICLGSITIPCMAEEDLSAYNHQVVEVKGVLSRGHKGCWGIVGKVFVESKTIELSEGKAKIIGIFWASKGDPKKKLPIIDVLEFQKGTEEGFFIKKYDRTVKLDGKPAKIVHQHPISPEISTNISYFDCSLGQIVVYFKSEKDLRTFEKGKEVVLDGKIFPVYAHSKRPIRKGETPQKALYGFSMMVEKVIPVK